MGYTYFTIGNKLNCFIIENFQPSYFNIFHLIYSYYDQIQRFQSKILYPWATFSYATRQVKWGQHSKWMTPHNLITVRVGVCISTNRICKNAYSFFQQAYTVCQFSYGVCRQSSTRLTRAVSGIR